MKYLPSLMIPFLFAGCASTPYKIDQSHEDRTVEKSYYKGKTLFIAPLVKEVTTVGNTSKVLEEGRELNSMNRDTLERIFNQDLTAPFERGYPGLTFVKAGPDMDRYNADLAPDRLIETMHRYGKAKVEYYFKHPSRDALEALGIRADLVVFICAVNAQVRDVEKGGGGGSMAPGVVAVGASGPVMGPAPGGMGFGPAGGRTVPMLGAFVKYIIWDYGKDAPAAFGQFQIEEKVDGDEVRELWKDFQGEVARRIVLNSSRLR